MSIRGRIPNHPDAKLTVICNTWYLGGFDHAPTSRSGFHVLVDIMDGTFTAKWFVGNEPVFIDGYVDVTEDENMTRYRLDHQDHLEFWIEILVTNEEEYSECLHFLVPQHDRHGPFHGLFNDFLETRRIAHVTSA